MTFSGKLAMLGPRIWNETILVQLLLQSNPPMKFTESRGNRNPGNQEAGKLGDWATMGTGQLGDHVGQSQSAQLSRLETFVGSFKKSVAAHRDGLSLGICLSLFCTAISQ